MRPKRSKHEATFALALKASGPNKFEEQYRFDPDRKWKFDFCHKESLTAIEIDGGEFMRGAHNRGAQMARDYEKRNQAILSGWTVFQLTGQMVQKAGPKWAKLIEAYTHG